MEDRKIFICECCSYEHQVIFWWDEDEKQVYATFHLVTYKNFFQRLWRGIRYAFGYKSKYGAWDEFLFSPEAKKQLTEWLNKANGDTSNPTT